MQRVIILCLSNLPAVGLGCYGQLRLTTPHFDELATQATVCERYYRSPSAPSLLEQLASLTENRLLIHESHPGSAPSWTDDRASRLDWPNRREFNEPQDSDDAAPLVVILPSVHEPAAELIEEVQLSWKSDTEMGSSEAPLLSNQKQVRQAAIAIDWEKRLPALLNDIAPPEGDRDLLIVTSLRGNADADPEEHEDWIRSVSETVVHLPLLLSGPGLESGRIREFVTADSLLELIRSCLSGGATDLTQKIATWQDGLETGSIRYSSQLASAVRTEEWLYLQKRCSPDQDSLRNDPELIADPADDADEVRLYRKPEDVWESMDLASQFPGVVDSFGETID